MTLLYQEDLNAQPFVIVSAPESQGQQKIIFGPAQLARRSDELIDGIHAAIPKATERSGVPTFCQVASWRGQLICATTIRSTLPEQFSGRQGLSLTIGCALPSYNILRHTDVALTVQRLLRKRLEAAWAVQDLVSQIDEALLAIRDPNNENILSRELNDLGSELQEIYGLRGLFSSATSFVRAASPYDVKEQAEAEGVADVDEFWAQQQNQNRRRTTRARGLDSRPYSSSSSEGNDHLSSLYLGLSFLLVGLLVSVLTQLGGSRYTLVSLAALDLSQILTVTTSLLLSVDGVLGRSANNVRALGCFLVLAFVSAILLASSVLQLLGRAERLFAP